MDGIQSSIDSLKATKNKLQGQIDSIDRALKNLVSHVTGGKTGKKRKALSPEARKKLSEAAKKRWANQKKAAKS